MPAKAICHVVIITQAEVIETDNGVRIQVGKPTVIPHTIIGKLDPAMKFSEQEIHELLTHATVQNAALEMKVPKDANLDKVETNDTKPEGPVN